MNGNDAGEGILYGAAGAWLINNRGYRKRVRRAEDAADGAQSTANQSLGLIQRLIDSGDMERLGSDQVSDLLLGLAYPGQAPSPTPSGLATAPTVLLRPQITEAIAQGIIPWPGAVNQYNADGKLINPGAAGSGQNFYTGLALGFGEVRAFLLGLAQKSDVTPQQAVQYYRLAQGLANAIATFGATGGLSQDQWSAIWARMIGTPSTPGAAFVSPQRIDGFDLPKTAVSGTTAETELARLTIPANTITKIGDRLPFELMAGIGGVNSTDTFQYRLRLDSLSGTVLFDSTAINPVAASEDYLSGVLVASAVGSTGQMKVAGRNGLKTTTTQPPAYVVSIDWTVAHSLIWTVALSSTNGGNTTQADFGRLLLEKAA